MRTARSTRIFVTLLLLGIFGACHRTTPPPPLVAAPPSPPLPPTISLSADRTTITAGQPITLTWQSANATVVTLDNAIGSVPVNGTRQVTPQASTSYSATARGPGGTSTSATLRINVNVVPPATAQRAAPAPSATTARTLSIAEQFQSTMQTILFDYDKATIRESEIPKLRSAARWLKDHGAVRFRIEGNADERGSQEYNVALGDERAAAVRKYFSDEGIPVNRMTTISYGEERPACKDETESCWQTNRRAQFVLTP